MKLLLIKKPVRTNPLYLLQKCLLTFAVVFVTMGDAVLDAAFVFCPY